MLALYHMGAIYHEQGKFDKAIEMYQDAIKNFPKKNKHDIAEAYQISKISPINTEWENHLDAWNTHIAEKYGKTLDRMKTKEKIELFNKIKVFT